MAAKPNSAAQQRIMDFLKAGGAELLTDQEFNCAMAMLEDDEQEEQVEMKEDDESLEKVLERIRELKVMEKTEQGLAAEKRRPDESPRVDARQKSAWTKPLMALAASVLIAFTVGYFIGGRPGPTGTLVAQVSSEQVTLRGGEDGLKLTVESPRQGFATLVLTGSAPTQVLPNVDADEVPVSDAAPGEFEIRREGYETAYVFVTQVPAGEFIRRFVLGSPPPDAARLRQAVEDHLREKGFEWVAVSSTPVAETSNQ